ncbi:pitrilysin family protein [Luedemannella helvata]|uniref:Pitrilysin family protein n=2 Tax=Luedemannella helvata TaxID=349315 RepID=A0ABN2KLH0_9ACTN
MRVSRGDISSTGRARSFDRARRGPAGNARAHDSMGGDDRLGGTVGRTVLPNGVRVLTEAIPAMRSVSVGMWVPIGSRDESPELGGVSHFLEHLLFKGTRRRTALDISSTIEAVGGETNAFTTKEYTCYYARVLDADLPLAIDVMGDLLTDSVLAAADVETERGVILEEIAMHDDEPDDEVHDLFAEAVYGEHPLGRLVSGTPTTIGAMSRRSILDFYEERYRGPALVVAAAGNLDHDTVVRLVEDVIGRADRFAAPAAPLPRRADPAPEQSPAPRVLVREKDTEQAHVLLGCPALSRDDERRFALGVLNNVVGGGMSARLFQEIREKRGLAYSIYSYTAQYSGSGLFGVYAGCAAGKVDEVLALAREQLAAVAADGLTDEEVRRGKGMLKGALVLGLEDTGSRMTRLAKSEMLYDELLSVNDLLARVDAVTPDDVRAVAAEVLTRPMSLAAIGSSLPDL